MEQCSICFEDEIDNEKMVTLGCKHVYHKQCLEKWCQENTTCPYCRDYITLPLMSKINQVNNDVYKIRGPLRKRKTANIFWFEISGINTELLNQAQIQL